MQRIKNRSGGCCCAGVILRVTVLGCNSVPVPGATVTATLSGTDYVATTGGGGVADVAVPGAGTYSVAVTYAPSARYATSTAGVVVGAGAVTTHSRTLAPAAGYACQHWEAPGGTGGRDCFLPLARTLFLTDSTYGGPVTLTYAVVGGVAAWSGSQPVSLAATACPAVTVNADYNLAANGPAGSSAIPSFCLGLSYQQTPIGCPNNAGTGGTHQDAAELAPHAVTCPPAFTSVHTYVATGFHRTYPVSTGTTTFTITE